MKWRLFKSGSCRHPEAVAVKRGDWRQVVFPALWAAVETPRGWLVVDTGYAPRVLDLCRRGWWRLYPLTLPLEILEEETAVRQMAGKPVAGVFLTHFHVDHEAGLRDFPSVPVYTSREGWEAARTKTGFAALKAAHAPELLPERFAEDQLHCFEWQDHSAPDWVPEGWRRGADMLGDGMLWAVPLPGHAAGQAGLMFRDDAGAIIFLAADALWRVDWLQPGHGPRWPVRFISHDWTALQNTLARLRSLAVARPDVRIIPFHCEETARAYGVAGVP